MSAPSDVITLKPMKGSELMKQFQEAKADGTAATARYVSPHKRGDEPKAAPTITAEQLGSESSFPSLPMMKPLTKGASWAQLRARLNASPSPSPKATEDSMKNVIESSLKKQEAEQEEAISRESITDPILMTKEQRIQNGWATLGIPSARRAWFNKSSYNQDPVEYVEPPSAWPTLNFTSAKVMPLIQPYYMDGTLVERPLQKAFNYFGASSRNLSA